MAAHPALTALADLLAGTMADLEYADRRAAAALASPPGPMHQREVIQAMRALNRLIGRRDALREVLDLLASRLPVL